MLAAALLLGLATLAPPPPLRRLLREAFRAVQQELPRGLDLVVVARPHEEWDGARYRAGLVQAARDLAPAPPDGGHGTGS